MKQALVNYGENLRIELYSKDPQQGEGLLGTLIGTLEVRNYQDMMPVKWHRAFWRAQLTPSSSYEPFPASAIPGLEDLPQLTFAVGKRWSGLGTDWDDFFLQLGFGLDEEAYIHCEPGQPMAPSAKALCDWLKGIEWVSAEAFAKEDLTS